MSISTNDRYIDMFFWVTVIFCRSHVEKIGKTPHGRTCARHTAYRKSSSGLYSTAHVLLAMQVHSLLIDTDP